MDSGTYPEGDKGAFWPPLNFKATHKFRISLFTLLSYCPCSPRKKSGLRTWIAPKSVSRFKKSLQVKLLILIISDCLFRFMVLVLFELYLLPSGKVVKIFRSKPLRFLVISERKRFLSVLSRKKCHLADLLEGIFEFTLTVFAFKLF